MSYPSQFPAYYAGEDPDSPKTIYKYISTGVVSGSTYYPLSYAQSYGIPGTEGVLASGYVGRDINRHLSSNLDSESDRFISGKYYLLGLNSIMGSISRHAGKQLVFIREGVGCVIRGVNKHTGVFMLETIGVSTKGCFESITSNIVGGGHISHKSIFYIAVSNMKIISSIQRLIVKNMVLAFNLSIYPLSYAQSYILPGTESVLANISGYVSRNLNKHISTGVASGSTYYPLSYAQSYILPGIGNVLTNASGYVSRNLNKHIAVSNIKIISSSTKGFFKSIIFNTTVAIAVIRVAVGGVIGSIFNKFYTYVTPPEYIVEDDE